MVKVCDDEPAAMVIVLLDSVATLGLLTARVTTVLAVALPVR